MSYMNIKLHSTTSSFELSTNLPDDYVRFLYEATEYSRLF